jgi:dTDP-4-amino-4,6-dideoxygalactose transaminase
VTGALPGPGRLARRVGTSAAGMAEPLIRGSRVWPHARAVEATRTVKGPRQRVRFVQLTPEALGLEQEILRAVARVVRRGDFILGADVALLEEEFAAYCGVRFAVGVDSGFSALELSLRAAGIGPGDEVITQANTFIATVGAILAVGAVPVLADCDAEGGPDAGEFAARLTERSRAIIPVHLFGRLADVEPFMLLAQRNNLTLIEDACQAHGARLGGRRAGSWGAASAFSFYPAKNLGALGDGGILVTDSPDIARRARALRHYGQRRKYEHEIGPPIGRRLDTLQAAAVRVKLPYLDSWNALRAQRAELYRAKLEGLPLTVPEAQEPGRHVYHLFVIRTDDRDALRSFLAERAIETGIHYPIPLHLQPALADLRYSMGDFPNAERLAATSLSLPMYPQLALDDLVHVTDSIRVFFRS